MVHFWALESLSIPARTPLGCIRVHVWALESISHPSNINVTNQSTFCYSKSSLDLYT